MKEVNLILFLMFSSFFNGHSQSVESSAYSVMLKAMLSHSVNEVSVKEAIGLNNKVLFIDSREKQEYNVSHIKDAIWVGYDNLNLSAIEDVDKEQEIIVYCSIGYRSEKIAEKLAKKGFKNVSNLYGGIFEWKNQGNKVYTDQNSETDSVHAYNKIWGIWLTSGEKVY